MKRASISFSFRAAPVVAVAIVIACGSDVIEDDGKGGGTTSSQSATSGGPSSTSPSSSVVASSNVAVTASQTTNASTGAGDACMQACDHAAMCGVPACQFFNPDCATTQGQCIAGCINAADCTQIGSLIGQMMDPVLVGCLTGCQGGGQGGGGGSMGCTQCVQDASCIPQGCAQEPDCQGWGLCALQCQTPQCFSDCNAMHPEATAFYEGVYSCSCANCEASCQGFMDACNQPGGQSGSTAVTTSGGGGAGGN